jgi:hypothetical protein
MSDLQPSRDPLPFSHQCYSIDEAKAEERRIEALGTTFWGLRVDLLGTFLSRSPGPFSLALIFVGALIAIALPLKGIFAVVVGTMWGMAVAYLGASLRSDGWPKYNEGQQRDVGLIEPLDEAVLTGMPQVIRLTEDFPVLKDVVGKWLREGKQLRQRDLLAMEEYDVAERERQRQVEYYTRLAALRTT